MKNHIFLLVVLLLTSCKQTRPVQLPKEVIQYDLPNVIVGEFEYKGALNAIPNVGNGFRDALIDKMIEKRYFDVLNRKGLTDTLTELELQNAGITRPEGRIKLARVKNARYILRGVINEFSTRVDASFVAEMFMGVVGLESRSDIISLQLMIEDLESNQVIISEAITESQTSGSINYQNVTFGTQVFWQSPLGEATAEALSRAIDYLIVQIPKKKWYASVIPFNGIEQFDEGNTVVLSGGLERGMAVGDLWQAIQPGIKLIDPNTLDDAGYSPDVPRDIVVELFDVNKKNAYGTIRKGKLSAGDTLSLLKKTIR